MVSILNKANGGYSSRAANAAYRVADEDKEAFLRFHSALFAQQPMEGSGTGPDNAALIETARQAGVVGGVPDCINKGRYEKMTKGLGGRLQDHRHSDHPAQRPGHQSGHP